MASIRNKCVILQSKIRAFFEEHRPDTEKISNRLNGAVTGEQDPTNYQVELALDCVNPQPKFSFIDYPLEYYTCRDLKRNINDWRQGRDALIAGVFDFDASEQICRLVKGTHLPHRISVGDGRPVIIIGEQLDKCLSCDSYCNKQLAYDELFCKGRFVEDLEKLLGDSSVSQELEELTTRVLEAHHSYVGIVDATYSTDIETGEPVLEGAYCRIILVNRVEDGTEKWHIEYTTGAPATVNDDRGLKLRYTEDTDYPQHLFMFKAKE